MGRLAAASHLNNRLSVCFCLHTAGPAGIPRHARACHIPRGTRARSRHRPGLQQRSQPAEASRVPAGAVRARAGAAVGAQHAAVRGAHHAGGEACELTPEACGGLDGVPVEAAA